MNAKGFTLIELTAIIVVLAAIFLVSFPSLLNIARVDEEKKYDSMVNNLCMAGETYIYTYIDNFEESFTEENEINISVIELISYGSVAKNVKNPKTGNLIEDDTLIYTVLSDNSLECKYIDN